MGISKIIAALALGVALLLNQASHAVACSCIAVYYTPCDYVQGVTVAPPTTVLRAVVLSKSSPASINDDITITADVTTVYTGDHVDEITFTTAGNSAACGVDLTIGEEYILSLYPGYNNPFGSTDDGADLLTVGLCDLARLWTAVPANEKADLAAGC